MNDLADGSPGLTGRDQIICHAAVSLRSFPSPEHGDIGLGSSPPVSEEAHARQFNHCKQIEARYHGPAAMSGRDGRRT